MTTLRTLECLVALLEHGSVSEAAAALHMSQPAVSRLYRGAGKESGIPVVERLWRGVRVTAAGRATAEEARVALHAAGQAIHIGKRVGRGGAGRLRISASRRRRPRLVPVLRHWRSRRPDVVLESSESTSADAMAATLAAGATDLAVGPRPTQTDAHVQVFGQEEMVVVAGRGTDSPECLRRRCLRWPTRCSRTTTRPMGWRRGSTSWPPAIRPSLFEPRAADPQSRTAAQLAAAGHGGDHCAGVGPGPAADGSGVQASPPDQARRHRHRGCTIGHFWRGVPGRPDVSWVARAGRYPSWVS